MLSALRGRRETFKWAGGLVNKRWLNAATHCYSERAFWNALVGQQFSCVPDLRLWITWYWTSTELLNPGLGPDSGFLEQNSSRCKVGMDSRSDRSLGPLSTACCHCWETQVFVGFFFLIKCLFNLLAIKFSFLLALAVWCCRALWRGWGFAGWLGWRTDHQKSGFAGRPVGQQASWVLQKTLNPIFLELNSPWKFALIVISAKWHCFWQCVDVTRTEFR